jgi:DNA-binding winged helix-turn-helix (wHTH) protein
MRSDKIQGVSVTFDGLATASMNVSRRAAAASAGKAWNRHEDSDGEFISPLAVRGRTVIDALDIADRVARLEGLVQRQIESRETILEVGPLHLDLIERTARRGDRTIALLPQEFRLLRYMMQYSGQLLKRSTLLEDVWHYKFIPKTNLVDVHMGRLRHKVNGPNEAPMIHNVRGAGFILRAPS